jgi:WD40 repeat protein
VRSATFSPDGRQIASASADKTVRLWDVTSGQLIRQLVGHTERVMSVAYSPDAQRVASAGADSTIHLWTTDIDLLLAQAHSLIQRDPPTLSADERKLYGME